VRYCSYFSLPLLVLFLATQESPGATNAPVVIPRPPVAPGLAYPVTVTTNESGVPVHQFSMKPAITNMAVATNDLAQLKAQLAGIEAETQKTSDEAGTLRKTMRNDYREIVGVMTNFTARNEEGKKLQDRITALETELKTRKTSDPELALHLHADEGVNYGIVAKVMSGIERAGVTKLSVLTIAQ